MDLQFSLAKSYSSTPELREAWLENMANTHETQKNYSEVRGRMTFVRVVMSLCEITQG